ncbi:MAG: phosphate acetyltransferase [Planctomycetota bacterium]|nr:MAG: phosphate acetyltransferase [Planctomycetota bacterium]
MLPAPAKVLESLRERVRAARPSIVFPEGGDERILRAAELLREDAVVEPYVLNAPEAPKTESHPRFEDMAALVQRKRAHKGMDLDGARKQLQDPLWFGGAMVALGEAAGMVAGAANATGDVIRAGLGTVGLAEGSALCSSCFVMARDDLVLSYADGGVVPDPSSEQLVDIARSTIVTHRCLVGSDPKVAFLSFSTRGSAAHARVDKVRAASELAKQRLGCPVDGELQVDAAIVPSVAQRKAPDSPLAGQANVLIFPDLDSGNIAYKLTQRLAGFTAIGPLLQGLSRPCLDLSRGCSAEDVYWVACCAAALAAQDPDSGDV